jgi:hypothetical protein
MMHSPDLSTIERYAEEASPCASRADAIIATPCIRQKLPPLYSDQDFERVGDSGNRDVSAEPLRELTCLSQSSTPAAQ